MPRQTTPSKTGRETASAFRRAESTGTISGACIHPIRLRGYYQQIAADTGEILDFKGSAVTGGATLLVRCKDRRASLCPGCARLYERDAYQLLAAGLRGGKNVPASVASHPAVLVTLTAPSFGAVHGNRDHGHPCRCGVRHDPADSQIGTPLDPGRYRYNDQVIWNHHAPELWKRTIQAIRRNLAQALGVPRSKLHHIARVRFAKVAEFQRRGVIHYHAIIRLDGPGGLDDPPPARCTTELLYQVIKAATEAATTAVAESLRAHATVAAVRWGTQREIVALDPHTCTTAAGYIAKYATKATETTNAGTLINPIRSLTGVALLPLADHLRTLITTAWRIGECTNDEHFKRWAHQFGYGGHTLTKSHRYSVTFGALRAARASWRLGSKPDQVIVRAQLTYAGRGQGSPKGPR
jgi:hypothetical protein